MHEFQKEKKSCKACVIRNQLPYRYQFRLFIEKGFELYLQQAQMSKKEIEELLRKGAYGALMDDDKAGDEFCEEDIDQILQRRTQVIQIESEGKGSTFAKVIIRQKIVSLMTWCMLMF